MTDAGPGPAGVGPTVLELTVGAPAHGGSCVAHAPDGRVVFVRHALPGERVRAVVTAARSKLLHADAVEVLTASADRVTPPCPYAGPGRCGGCDLQHATPAAQRRWKGDVLADQLRRMAGLAVDVQVEALPEAPGAPGPGLGWRTRIRYAADRAGRLGLHAHASHVVVPLERCLLAARGVEAAGVLEQRWPGIDAVEVVVGDGPARVRSWDRVGRPARPDRRGGRRPERGRPQQARPRLVSGPAEVHLRAGDREVGVHGFWQVHPAAAATLRAAVLDLLAPAAGERALDLYAGAGLFALALAEAGVTVTAVEGDRQAASDAVAAAAGLPVEVRHGEVHRVLAALAAADPARPQPGPAFDLVVLDPPRAGAGTEVAAAVTRLGARAVAYVACDPAALARDLVAFAAGGYELAALRAFDCFPMTHHVEAVALLRPHDRA